MGWSGVALPYGGRKREREREGFSLAKLQLGDRCMTFCAPFSFLLFIFLSFFLFNFFFFFFSFQSTVVEQQTDIKNALSLSSYLPSSIISATQIELHVAAHLNVRIFLTFLYRAVIYTHNVILISSKKKNKKKK